MRNDTTPVPKCIADAYRRFSKLNVKELPGEIEKRFGKIKQYLNEIAAMIRLCEEADVTINDIKSGLVGYLGRMAYGQLHPDLLHRFYTCGRLLVLKRISRLPMPEQEKLAQTMKVSVFFRTGGPKLVSILALTEELTHQVFANDHTRTSREQDIWLRTKENNDFAMLIPMDRVTVDKKRKGIVVKGLFIPQTQLLQYLTQIAA